jgi:hypothetical protein
MCGEHVSEEDQVVDLLANDEENWWELIFVHDGLCYRAAKIEFVLGVSSRYVRDHDWVPVDESGFPPDVVE